MGLPQPLLGQSPLGTKEAVDGGCTHPKKEFLRFRPDLERAFLVEHRDNLGKEWGQPFGTDATTGFPYLKKGSLHIWGVDPRPSPAVQVLRLSSVAKKSDSGLAVVAGKGHEFVQNQSFLFPTGAKIPGSPGFHKLGYTGLGHRFLLLSVIQFMRNR